MARPKSFVPHAAVADAIRVFTRHGFHGTTVDLLVQAMGISRQSLYDTYGDKTELFLRCLDQYWRDRLAPFLAPRPQESGMSALTTLLVSFAARVQTHGQLGCLLVTALAEASSLPERAAESAVEYSMQLRRGLTHLIERAQEDGECPVREDAASVSSLLATGLFGIAVAAKSGENSSCVREALNAMLRRLHT